MPYRIPLFPLSVVLFPGTPLPLHIFETRYRQMVADVLEEGARFGITPSEAEDPPLPGAIGCVAHIRASQVLPDGRSNIIVTGEKRFVVRALLDSNTEYYVASVEEFDDEPGTAAEPDTVAALRQLAERYREALALLNDSAGATAEWPEDPAALTFQVAALAELPVPTKAELLALRSTSERVGRLMTVLPALADAAEERARVHVRARSNGRGGRHSEIVTDT